MQGKSMPGVLSGSATVSFTGHTLGDVPVAVTGPAVRACGACHRAQAINTNDPGRLALQRTHWETFGYYIETTSDVQEDAYNLEIEAIWAQAQIALQNKRHLYFRCLFLWCAPFGADLRGP